MKVQPLVVASGVIGRGRNNQSNPHHVCRRDGTSLWLLEYTVSGMGWIRAGDAVIPSEPGDFFIYKPLVTQDYGMDVGVGSWDHIWLSFSPRPHWHDWLHWPEKSNGLLVLRMPDRATRKHLLARMEHALKISAGMHARRRDFTLNVLEEILLACDEWNPAGKAARLDDRIRAALKHLCDHLAETITLQDLAKVCGLSPSRLSHLFKEQVGETPLQYLEQRRIEAARDLLQMTSKSVAQVAYEVGFNNPFYFSRVYRRKTGIQPSAARQHRKT
jgi:AraC family transcriptional regulator of arabinose operon